MSVEHAGDPAREEGGGGGGGRGQHHPAQGGHPVIGLQIVGPHLDAVPFYAPPLTFPVPSLFSGPNVLGSFSCTWSQLNTDQNANYQMDKVQLGML